MNLRQIICVLVLVSLSTSATSETNAVRLVTADPASGFNVPYFLSAPEKPPTKQTLLLVESNNTGLHESFDAQIESTKAYAEGYGVGPSIARALDLPLLVPVFPRTKQDWRTYTHALDRDTLMISEGQLERLDLQLLAMVDHASNRLIEQGFEVNDRFLLCGFSASGAFANRFAVLHPGSLVGVISGGVNGIPILPVAELSNKRLIYPVGVGDVRALTGNGFNKSEWQKIPQLIFMGAQDTNDATLFDDGYSETERSLIHDLLGERMLPDRWIKAQSIYLQTEANVTFVTYGEVGHGTNLRVRQDLINFTRAILRNIHE